MRVIILFSVLLPCFCSSQTLYGPANSAICKRLAIESAQLAHQSYLYSKESYFNTSFSKAEKNVDTAIFYIKESIYAMDSAIILASDSDLLALKYAKISKEFANRSYRHLMLIKSNETNTTSKNELSKEATFYSAHATADAYHASFYFKDNLKPKQKTEEPLAEQPVKVITKLDIDQTLFTLLNEELGEKEGTNTQEILKLTEELKLTKDPAKQQKLKNQLKQLELKKQELSQKKVNAQQKLNSINALIEERDKNKTTTASKEETIFSKSISKTSDEWNKQLQMDSELPDGLIYQIQLGVYKRAVVPEIFKGLTPIYGKTTNNGVSYSTGLFEKLVDAREAKTYVLNLGLKDAFIVAYYNKKKIPLPEAQKLEKK